MYPTKILDVQINKLFLIWFIKDLLKPENEVGTNKNVSYTICNFDETWVGTYNKKLE